MLNKLIEIAQQAGTRVKEMQFQPLETHSKGGLDIATAADLESERIILEKLKEQYPNIPVVSEEQDSPTITTATFFTDDPLDATIIYAAGFDEYGLMIGYVENGQPQAGVIYLPARNILIAAERGKGCTLNGQPVHLKSNKPLKETVIGGEVGWWIQDQAVLDTVIKLKNRTRGIRAIMSFAGAIADLIHGRIGAYLNPQTNIWEAATSSIIIEEVGGVVTTTDGQKPQWNTIKQSFVAASSQALHDEILTALDKKS